jgi:hypothetical protein
LDRPFGKLNRFAELSPLFADFCQKGERLSRLPEVRVSKGFGQHLKLLFSTSQVPRFAAL